VAVLEAGGLKPDAEGLDALKGELADPSVHPFLHHFRVRALGGASRIWGGRCIPLDAIDFAERPWVAGSGWPFGPEALAPYYPLAQAACEAGPFDYDPASALPGRPASLVPGLDGETIATTLERFSKPTDFSVRYRTILTRSANVRLLLNAPVAAVRLTQNGATTDHLEVARKDGRRIALRARCYVLAMGGLEVPRLLMASNDVRPAGIGGDHDQVGRYYMSHLAATSGTIVFNGPPAAIPFDYETDAAGAYVRRRLWITEAAQRQAQILNTTFRTHLPDPSDPTHGDAVLSAMYLVKDLVLYEYSRKMRDQGETWAGRARHLGNVLRQPLRLASFGLMWTQKRILAERKLPSVVLGSKTNRYALEFHAEQAPNPDSRLTLSAERDRLGVPRLRADWRACEADTESLKRAYALLAGALERTGTGRLEYEPGAVVRQALKEGAYGGHHIGAARMADDPRRGVVDADCRVHGVENLYVASSAVFPTSGQANPTLTILALAFRLVDHLKQRLAEDRAA
jgi:choline dehydrogenase-like flavoprotein